MMYISVAYCHIFFFNDTATTEIYTLSLHDALPICDTASSPPTVSPGSWRRSATTPDSGAGTAVGLADRPNPPAIEFSCRRSAGTIFSTTHSQNRHSVQ